jgi:hypothetical protein
MSLIPKPLVNAGAKAAAASAIPAAARSTRIIVEAVAALSIFAAAYFVSPTAPALG